MMRAAILALCLVGVLVADDKFVDHPFEVLIDSTKPGTDTMSITYSINKPASFKPGNPVFYGTGGRVSIEDLKSQYDLFNSVIPDFDNATVVFVEQRYFGNSQSSKAIKTVADLAQLKLDNVVADHVALIKKLSADLKTRNFMIFGGGHGGLIAGYLTKHFNDGKDKTVTGFNVMGWSSSPPIKYVRRQNVDPEIAIIHQIGPQFSAVLKGAVSTCHPEYLQNLFQKLKAAATDAAFVGALWLAPTPTVSGAADASDDIKELSVFIRNQLLGLTFADGLPYIPNTNQLNPERILKVLCDKINALDTAAHTTTDNINALLGVLGASATSKLRWKVTDDGFGKINRDLVWQAYQDCTEYQIAYCQPADPGTGDDPFSGSSWVSGVCDTTIKLGATIQAGCTGIFRSLLPADKANFDVSGTQLNKDTYPVALGGFRVLTTINPMSVFGTEPTTQGFGDTDKGKYASFLKVGFTDNWEFRKPRECDGDTTKKVRYMALRAFGCLGNFITDKAGKKDICKDPTKLFDIATTADPTAFPGTCAVNGLKFPFGQDELKFVDPYYKPPTTTTLASTQAQTTVSTTTKGGAGFIPSMMIVLTSGLLVWFTGL